MGIPTGRDSRGHRFHSSGPISIAKPGDYLGALEKDGYVIADFLRRRDLVRDGVVSGGRAGRRTSLSMANRCTTRLRRSSSGPFRSSALSTSCTSICRVRLSISTLTGHQRYFPVADDNGDLLPHFITVANIESKDPEQVIEGNERVIRPRLADAAFFWNSDRKRPLASREENLRDVVYQRGLGSLFDKSQRVAASPPGWPRNWALIPARRRSAPHPLAKCDLVTGMVGEFPDLQGTMGRYYALSDGEPDAVADAIGEQYLPRFSGDDLPESTAGQILAVADKLDSLAGIFSIGKKPSGNRDPFGLRRAALGIVRILIERGIDVDLKALIAKAVAEQPAGKTDNDDISDGSLRVY